MNSQTSVEANWIADPFPITAQTRLRSRQSWSGILATALFMFAVTSNTNAQILPTPNYGGDLRSRSTLTGDWGGTRSAWAEKGFHVGLDSVLTYQNLFDGGFDEDDGLIGSTVLALQLDTGKAGLWPGGVLTLRAEGRYGNDIQSAVGALSSVNTDAIFPNVADHVGEDVLAVTELSLLQFLSPKVGVIAGLLNTETGDANELAGSARSNNHFLNTGLLLSLVAFRTAPETTLGAGLIFLPNERIQGSLTVIDSEESAGENPFDTQDGTTIATEWGFRHSLMGRQGKQTIGFAYGFNRDYTEAGLDARTLLRGLLPGQSLPTKDHSWAFYYNAHQYVQQWGGDRGWGLFGRFGISDGDVNPVDWNAALGIGGKGLLRSRPRDTFGIGYYRIEVVEGALTRLLDLGDEEGVEAFYNFAVTPWLHVTADLQVIDTAFGMPGSVLLPRLGPTGLLSGRPIASTLAAVPEVVAYWLALLSLIRYCAKRSLAYLAGCKSPSGKGQPPTRIECCACGGAPEW